MSTFAKLFTVSLIITVAFVFARILVVGIPNAHNAHTVEQGLAQGYHIADMQMTPWSNIIMLINDKGDAIRYNVDSDTYAKYLQSFQDHSNEYDQA